MRMTNLISASLLSAVLSTGVAEASLAQGGWRQWEVRLRRRDVAYLVFAPPDSASTTCQRQESWHQPDLTYPIGSQQAPTLCFGYCRT